MTSDDLGAAFGRAWNRFWFTPADPLPCCVLRIAVGLIALAHFACLTIDLDRWYATDGLLPPSAVRALLTAASEEANYRVSYFNYVANETQLRSFHVAAMIVAAAFTAGLFTRVSGVLTLIGVLAYVHRVPQVAGLVEPLLAFLLAYLSLAPSGACLSVDAMLRGRKKSSDQSAAATTAREPSIVASIGLRLIQVHLAMFCAMMGLSKLYGDAWWEGNAIWILLAQTQSRPLNFTAIRNVGQFGEYLINLWTHATVYFQLAFPVLIWNRAGRPFLLTLGVIVWGFLILATGELLFGITMVLASLAFLPVESFDALLSRRRRL